MRIEHSPVMVVAGLLLLGTACTNPTGEIGSESRAIEDPPIAHVTPDGGTSHMRTYADTDRRAAAGVDELSAPVQCVTGYDRFVCNGGCPGSGDGCCVTGVRPLGVCRTLDGCTEQCAHDCGLTALYHGVEAGLQCEALCTWVSPEAECTMRR